MDKEFKVEITEIFMAKAGKDGWDRCFHGTIKREKDMNDAPVVHGKIKINDGFIYASAEDQWKLGEMLDELVLFVLDGNLHETAEKTIPIVETKFFLN